MITLSIWTRYNVYDVEVAYTLGWLLEVFLLWSFLAHLGGLPVLLVWKKNEQMTCLYTLYIIIIKVEKNNMPIW